MKEQYQREVSQIHVPSELLLKTKQAMKEEEEHLNGKNRVAKVIPFRVISIAAAAVFALVIAVPLASGFFRTGGEEEMKSPGVQLAGTVQPELGAISKGDGEQGKALTVTEADGIPEEWSDLEEITVGGKQITVTTDEKTGFWMAYDEQAGVVITSEMIEKEAFLKILENEL